MRRMSIVYYDVFFRAAILYFPQVPRRFWAGILRRSVRKVLSGRQSLTYRIKGLELNSLK